MVVCGPAFSVIFCSIPIGPKTTYFKVIMTYLRSWGAGSWGAVGLGPGSDQNEPQKARLQRRLASKPDVLENELLEARFRRLLALRQKMLENGP